VGVAAPRTDEFSLAKASNGPKRVVDLRPISLSSVLAAVSRTVGSSLLKSFKQDATIFFFFLKIKRYLTKIITETRMRSRRRKFMIDIVTFPAALNAVVFYKVWL
jgi:hypothetical protein